MPRYALETIGASATAPGAGGAAMAAVAGDSLRIRDSAKAHLLDVMQAYQVVGHTRITSPLIHDNVVGLTIRTPPSSTGKPARTLPYAQSLTPQDTLTLQAVGSATAGDVELAALQIMYEDLAGVDANLIMPSELEGRAIELFAPRVTITSTAAGWTGTVAITALDDQLKANQEYAWCGIRADGAEVNALAVGMVSPDWGNLRIGCPIIEAGSYGRSSAYFVALSADLGYPLIPVFNASQKSNILLTVLANENVVTVDASLMLVRLAPKSSRGRR